MGLVKPLHIILQDKALAKNGISPLKLLAILAVLTLTLSTLTIGTVKAEAIIWAQTSDPSTGNDEAYGVAVDGSGVYIVGYDGSPGGADTQWRIEKRSLIDGSLIPTFGTGGVVTSNPSTWFDAANGVAADSSGIYIVGTDSFPGWGDFQWRIEKRSLTDGSLIPTFGTGGVVTSNPSGNDDQALAVAVDGSGVYIVGYDKSLGAGDPQWRIEKRSLTDGSLLWPGAVTSNPSAGYDIAWGVAVDGSGIYIVGSDLSLGDAKWRIEKRSLTDGSLIPTFGTGGVVTSNPSAGSDVANGVAVDGSGIYIVGRDQSPGDDEWRIEKRNLTDGSLIWAQTNNPSTGADNALAVAVDGSGIYIVGRDESPGPGTGYWQWRIEKRSLTDGSLIWPQTSNPSAGSDVANGVAVDGSGIYIVGYDKSPDNLEWRIEKRDLGILPARPVGGVLVSVNKLAISAPYIALVGLVGAVTAAFAVKRRRKS